MKKTLKFLALVLAAMLILGFAGCDGDDSGDDKDKGDGGVIVPFNSFSSPSIYVDNKSGERLVAFKGSLNPNYLISGIPPYATNHGLAKTNSVNSTLFTQTGDFALILITEAQYNANKNNLGAATVFAEIYAFYNHEATNNNSFRISDRSGGSGRITLNNPTNWNIEIRREGPTGDVLGYVASQMTNTVLRVEPGDYSLYPVFKRYNPSEKEIYEIVPTYGSGDYPNLPYAKDFVVQANGTTSWNLKEVADMSDLSLTSGSFYLRIVNNSNTSIRFTRGDTEQYTSTGFKGIEPSDSHVYSVKITRNPDRTYPTSQQIAQLKIGTPQIPRDVPTHTYKLDYVYTIVVTGANAASLVLGEIQESDAPLDIEAMFR
jgi:hypothetical protein